MKSNNDGEKRKTYSYKTRCDKIRLRIIDGMDAICESKGKEAMNRAKYYDSYNLKATDPVGSYTGFPAKEFGVVPVQDADDL